MNLHDKDREASVNLIKAALSPEHGVDQRHMLDKGEGPGHPFRGNQHQGGDGGDSPVSMREAQAPKFVHEFLSANNTGAKQAAALKEKSDAHLETAIRLLEGREDLASSTVRTAIRSELSSRAKKSETAVMLKGDLPGHEFRGNQHTGGGGGKNGNTGTIRPKKWDGVEQLKAGHIVNLTGDDAFEHVVLEAQDDRGDMPRVLVAAMGTGMSIAPTERVDRTFVRPAASVEAVRARFVQEAAKDKDTKASTARTITMNALAQRAGFSNAQQAYEALVGSKPKAKG